MSSPLVLKTSEYVKAKLLNEHTGHDWYHVQRIWKIVRRLHRDEGGDLELIELTALLHDLGDYKQYEFNEVKGSLVLHGMMDVLDIDDPIQNKIIHIVDEAQYNGLETRVPCCLEGKIIQDADWLDALGAIGIARTFATGGSIHRVIHDPKRKPRKELSKHDYQMRKTEGTSINYFYEKVLKLPKMLNTKTAKEIAARRVEFIKLYLNEFVEEWEGKR